MSIQEYVRILRRRGWIIVLAAIVTATSAFVFSKLQNPLYRSSVQVSIQLARPDFGLTQSAKQLLRSYTTVMHTKERAQLVIDELGLFMEPADLIGDVKIEADDSIMVIQIDVDDYDGEQANRIANAWAHQLIDWRNEQNMLQDKEDRVYAEDLDPASYRQIRPKTAINVAAGGFVGLTLGVAIVFVLEWLEAGVVRDPRDLERETGITVISVVPPISR